MALQAAEGERCMCGEFISNCACEAFEDDRQSLCQMSDSACSLNEGEPSTATQETWLVQEYCSLGTLQVQLHASACLVHMIDQQSAPTLQPGDPAGAAASLPVLHTLHL